MDIQSFKEIYPNVTASDPAIEQALIEASLVTGEGWAELRETGIGLYAAHVLTLDKKAGTTGKATQAASSKKVGEVQISYATNQNQDAAWYELTNYGQRYWQLWSRIKRRTLACFVM